MRVSTSTKASMLACGSCRPRIHTTSIRDGSTVSGQPPRPEEPEQPKMGLFQTPARPAGGRFTCGEYGIIPRLGLAATPFHDKPTPLGPSPFATAHTAIWARL